MKPLARAWGVAALVHAVGDTLAARYGTVLVRGEISGFSRAGSGHGYFTLKDESGQCSLRCAIFRRALSQVAFMPSDGQLVQARGQLSVYEARGELQLVVDELQSAGAGALYEQFLRLKAKLELAGLFDEAAKRPVPPYPRRIAVVTSTAAAALQDVLTTLQRRAPHVEVCVLPTAVQGFDAPEQIEQALQIASKMTSSLGARAPGLDAVILCRGGGSLEDLWSFNDERVVRAIRACSVPVVCGVGHETDITLADLAADLRAPTPTAAAEMIAQARDDALAELGSLATALQWRCQQRLGQHMQRLDQLASRLARPAQMLGTHQQRLAMLENNLKGQLTTQLMQARHRLGPAGPNLHRALMQRIAAAHQRHDSLAQRLEALNPKRVLERGYAWLSNEHGEPVVRAAQAQQGQDLTAHMADGRMTVRVNSIDVEPKI